MSIEKLSDDSRTQIQRAPFTQVCNSVILEIKDNDAFRVYCFLQSKSQTWVVIKSYVQEQCNVGERKSKQIFAYLNRCKLIRYVTTKDSLGRHVKTDIHVLNGLDFDPNEPFKDISTSEEKLSTDSSSTGALSARAETHTCGNAGLLNKDITKERLILNTGSIEQKKPKAVDKSSYYKKQAAPVSTFANVENQTTSYKATSVNTTPGPRYEEYRRSLKTRRAINIILKEDEIDSNSDAYTMPTQGKPSLEAS